GLPVKEMDLAQLHLAHALLSTALGNRGYYKASAIMSMEAVLGEIEAREGSGNSRITRDPGLYYFSIFGDPLPDHPWGWRVEGHHLSINITAADGKLAASSPFFLGSNPHEVLDGPHKGLRILGAEEDLGRDLLKSLDDAQRGRAVISAEAPKDIFTTNQRKADLGGEPKGLPYPAMNQDQQQRLRNLIDEYISNLHPYLADLRREKISRMTGEQWSQTYFAWMGGPDKGQPDYYRVQTPLFLIEYDNTPNNANHSHTVWRDFNGDFGLDLLAMHHARDHALPFNP
ncbi:DUF3500 domain-containing protein, partial [Candidatus Sumerlaeota bacterium]|nr:DUF3500 domain-containing protein [Candidatus Sumerlaeota bacterium]